VPVFADTSALYPLLTTADEDHNRSAKEWARLAELRETLITSNYVVVEAMALIGKRLGTREVRDFQREIVPVLEIIWVDAELHQQAVAALLTAGLRDLSLVDCVSFEIMRHMGIERAFAFDAHFKQQGFTCLG
jgi:predicted nucleic acid-binding protein